MSVTYYEPDDFYDDLRDWFVDQMAVLAEVEPSSLIDPGIVGCLATRYALEQIVLLEDKYTGRFVHIDELDDYFTEYAEDMPANWKIYFDFEKMGEDIETDTSVDTILIAGEEYYYEER